MDRPEEKEVPTPYVISTHIGKGSFADVYKGYHGETHQQVAIKTIKRDGLTTKLLDNLKSEIDILKSLSHRHITKLLDIVRGEYRIYLIMEFCSGGDLTNYIKKRGRVEGLEYIPSPGAAPQYYSHPRTGGLNEIVVRSFLRQLARALKFLRTRNLVHRDIKPQNLLLNPASPEELARGHPLGVPILKVADFGFARSLPNAMLAETLCGSPLYMAPEILRYEKYDAKADLWSVGAVLYEMAVGRPPFRAQNHIELQKKIEQSRNGPKFPDEDPRYQVNADGKLVDGKGEEVQRVPDDVKQLIRGLLKKLPAERLTFEEFFKSTALAKSKFPRPSREPSRQAELEAQGTDPSMPNQPWPQAPEHHKIIPPEVLDPHAVFPPSKFNFRRTSSTSTPQAIPRRISPGSHSPAGSPPSRPSPLSRSPYTSPRRNVVELPTVEEHDDSGPNTRPFSTEASIIAGETDEDGQLRREYVLVSDTRAVEFNRAVDEINSARRVPLHSRRVSMPPTPDGIDIPSTNANTTFPPPPSAQSPGHYRTLSSSPTAAASRAATNALSRALNLASKKLFGNGPRSSPPTRDTFVFPPSPRRTQLNVPKEEERDPAEDLLLQGLEELAQKTDVLTNWADELYEYVKAIPQKPLPDPNKFAPRSGESERHANRRKIADQEAESNAITAVAVYMLVMSFAQKGIDKLRDFQEHARMRDPDGSFAASEGFDEALAWYKDRFLKCADRVALVKTWLPTHHEGPSAYLYPLVYERALMLSRTAARKELLDQQVAPDESEKLYEESLWCLYTLKDDLLQSGNPFMDEDRSTIATWIKRTKLRLVRCRARMAMPDRERLQDARADQNLEDVQRIPAPAYAI
ncbi:kinase-like protein [Punctularia strigosozonata HHB-11173 SS5]|uniref:kinase-like protein n=1 Tax=Punctularia strigosozonata (strain HHB-11173) TaxID=741275 RepID=UPI00044181A1|nr:kinase-like protein [Punctularia strigosozonata HHB-11173 SS5]EIN14702.1 kinase-like protein [Punctularia strigosozonata HHB-11173 SS5]